MASMIPPRLPLPPWQMDLAQQAQDQFGQGGQGLPQPPQNSPGLNVAMAEPHRGVLEKILPFLPAAIGTGMAAFGGDNVQAFGAGLAGGSVNSLVDQHMQKRDWEHKMSQNQLKNLDDLISKMRQLDDMSDPRHHHAQTVVQDYDSVLASGKLDGKQIQRLLAAANSVGPVETLLGEKQQRAQLQQYEAQKNIEDKLRRQNEQTYNIDGNQLRLEPGKFADYVMAKERDRVSMNRFLQAQANQDRRAGFGPQAQIDPGTDSLITTLADKVTSGQYTPQQAAGMLGHGPSAYPLHRALEAAIQATGNPVVTPQVRQRLAEVDTSLNYLNKAEELGKLVSNATTPEEFTSAVDQYKSFVEGTTAVLPRAFGDRGNIAATEGARALAALPNWERRALFPQHSQRMLSNLRNFIKANRNTIVTDMLGNVDVTGAKIGGNGMGVTTGNSASGGAGGGGGGLTPPPGQSRFTIISRH